MNLFFNFSAMNDITNRKDIERLVNEFYSKALVDEQIGHFFSKVVELNLTHHIPTICDFWEMVLFDTGGYKANLMEKHFELHRKSPIREKHFDRWLILWEETVSNLYTGPKADEAKQRAKSIAGVMQLKIESL